MNIAGLLNRNANQFDKKPAIFFKDSPVSFVELRDRVFKLANALTKLGVRPQDRVGVYLPNWPEYAYSYLALFCLGATVVPLDYMLTEEEMASCLNHCEAKYLIAKAKNIEVLNKLKSDVSALENVILAHDKEGGFLNLEDLMFGSKVDFEERDIDDKSLSLIMYTSGTTGRPKGIMLTYKHLDACPEAMRNFVDFTDKDTIISVLPFSHIAGLMYIQITIDFGVTLVLMDRFIPLEFLKNIEKYKVNCFYLVPSMYYAILQLKEFEKFDLSSIRWVNVFGAPNAPEVLRRFHQYCPHASFLNGWGLTETCGPCVVTPLGSEMLESVGKPAPWVEVRIVDDDGNELPRGQIGEILLKSWIILKGYYKDREETDRTIRDGWFYTGDLGKFDDEGYLYILGRKKEMIKVAGELVYATEVEAVLAKHPRIKEVAVVGAPDKLRGEVVRAVVAPKDGVKVNEEEIRYFAKEHLAHFKVPSIIDFMDSLPKNRVGKIDKTQLK